MRKIVFVFVLILVFFVACSPVPTSQPLPTLVALSEPVVVFSTTDMILGDNSFDTYKCQAISADGARCLDKEPNPPISFVHPSVYGPPSPTIVVESRDLDNNKFEVSVQNITREAAYGSCVLADVFFQEVWLDVGAIYNTQMHFTICYVDDIWYFHYHM